TVRSGLLARRRRGTPRTGGDASLPEAEQGTPAHGARSHRRSLARLDSWTSVGSRHAHPARPLCDRAFDASGLGQALAIAAGRIRSGPRRAHPSARQPDPADEEAEQYGVQWAVAGDYGKSCTSSGEGCGSSEQQAAEGVRIEAMG